MWSLAKSKMSSDCWSMADCPKHTHTTLTVWKQHHSFPLKIMSMCFCIHTDPGLGLTLQMNKFRSSGELPPGYEMRVGQVPCSANSTVAELCEYTNWPETHRGVTGNSCSLTVPRLSMRKWGLLNCPVVWLNLPEKNREKQGQMWVLVVVVGDGEPLRDKTDSESTTPAATIRW